MSLEVCTLTGRRGKVIVKKRAKENYCAVGCNMFMLATNTSAHTHKALVFTR